MRALFLTSLVLLFACGGSGSSPGPVQQPADSGTPTASVPAAPSGLTVTPGIRQATLQWTAPADNGSAITGYRVEVSSSGGPFAAATASISGTSAQVTGLANGGSYRFQVAAQNAAGEGPMSAPSQEVRLPDVPAAPVISVAQLATELAPLVASVPAEAGVTYFWSVEGGTLTGSANGTTAAGTNSITWTAGPAGTATLHCTASNAAGSSTEAIATVQLFAAPVTPAITVAQHVTTGAGASASVTARAGMTYQWTISGGTLDASTGDTVTFTAGPAGTLTLGCTETNGAGAGSSPASASVSVETAPVTPTIAMRSTVTAGATESASVTARAGMTYAWTLSGGTLNATTGASITFVPDASGTVTLGCTETNAAGTSSTPGSASAPIAPAPVTPTIAAPSKVALGATGQTAVVTAHAGMTYAWTIVGGTLSSTTGSSVTFSATDAKGVTLGCTETNAAGDSSAAGSASVAVVVPSASLLAKPTQTTTTYGSDVTFTAKDNAGNPLQGVSVSLSASSSSGKAILSASSGTTDANGRFATHVGDSTQETVQLSANASFTGVAISVPPVSITFGPAWRDIDSASPSTASIAPLSLAIDPANPSNLWLGGGNGSVLRSTNGGGTWSTTSGINGQNVWAIVVTHPGGGLKLYALSSSGPLFTSTNGTNFIQSAVNGIPSGVAGYDLAVDPSDPSQLTVYLAAATYGVFVTRNAGGSWTSLPLPNNDEPVRLAVDTQGTAYAAGGSGALYALPKGATQWMQRTLTTMSPVSAVAVQPTQNLILVGFGDGEVNYSWDGVSYAPVAAGGDSYVNDCAWGADGAAWLATDTTGLFRSPQAGSGFTQVGGGLLPTQLNAVRVDPTDPLTVYAVGSSGIWKTTTGGK